VRYVIAAGVHGIFVLGSTGESPALSDQQRLEVMRTAIRSAAGQVPVLVGILDCSVRHAIEFGRAAEEAGADALVVVPPFYFVHTQNEILRYFRILRAALQLPISAYNAPTATKVHLAPQTVDALAQERLIVALKDSSADLSAFRQILLQQRSNDQLHILTGRQDLIDMELFMGAHGMVPGLANEAPQLFVRLYEAAQAKRWEEARAVQESVLPLLDVRLFSSDRVSRPAAAVGAHKTCLKLLGVIATNTMAAPWDSLGPEAEEGIAALLREHGIL